MHAGEKMQFTCPSYLAHGPHSFYAEDDDSSFEVPANTVLTYTLTVIDCKAHEKDL